MKARNDSLRCGIGWRRLTTASRSSSNHSSVVFLVSIATAVWTTVSCGAVVLGTISSSPTPRPRTVHQKHGHRRIACRTSAVARRRPQRRAAADETPRPHRLAHGHSTRHPTEFSAFASTLLGPMSVSGTLLVSEALLPRLVGVSGQWDIARVCAPSMPTPPAR
jgi:hypothetical protein